VHKPKSINELLKVGGKTLTALKAKSEQRTLTLDHVCAALPANLAEHVVSAGVEHCRLTIGVAGATWAARLRYATETLKTRVGAALGVEIESVRIKVVPPRA
jgi:hypothetical protein